MRSHRAQPPAQPLRPRGPLSPPLRSSGVTPTLYTFGSSATNTFSRSADLDLCLIFAKDHNGHLTRGDVQDRIERFGKVLQRDRSFHGRISRITNAKVPIIKKEGGAGLSFDVSLSSFCGVRNSALMRLYVNRNRMVQPMAMAVVGWSKVCPSAPCNGHPVYNRTPETTSQQFKGGRSIIAGGVQLIGAL